MPQSSLSVLQRRWRELAGYALLFRLVESLLFAPAAALAGKWLVSQPVIDSTAVISFLLSARGFLALALAATAALAIRLVEHAGLSAVFFGGFQGFRVSARAALGLVSRNLVVLLGVAGRFFGAGLTALVPLAGTAAGLAIWLLPRHDINYYLKLRPPEFLAAALVLGLAATLTLALLLALVVRWRWVVQAVLFQGLGARAAFAESARLTRGVRWRLALALAGVTLASLALGLLASVLGSACTPVVLALTGRGTVSLAVAFGTLLLLRTLIGAICTFLGACLDAGLFTGLYRRRAEEVGTPAAMPDIAEESRNRPRFRVAALVAMGPLVMAISGGWLALSAIPEDRPITIHAHRGVCTEAPENTLGAARAAIAAGADYLEIDAQLSKDDVLVVAHDSDFSRLGGVARKVWDLTYEEIRAIRLGGTGHVTPTFEELLAEVKGRIKLNIELKYYGDHQPGLARKVVEAVRRHGMLDQVIVQCLEYEPLLEVRQLAPEVPVGYLLSFNAREPSRLDVQFLSVEQSRLNRSLILKAHRNGQQVYPWTVNKSKDMQRAFDLGVDGLITDQSALARQQRANYEGLPERERAMRRFRAWLVD